MNTEIRDSQARITKEEGKEGAFEKTWSISFYTHSGKRRSSLKNLKKASCLGGWGGSHTSAPLAACRVITMNKPATGFHHS